MDEALLEPDVLDVAEPAVGLSAGGLSERTLSTTWSHDSQQLGRHGAGHGRRVAAAAVIDVRQDVADDREPRLAADDVRAGRGRRAGRRRGCRSRRLADRGDGSHDAKPSW